MPLREHRTAHRRSTSRRELGRAKRGRDPAQAFPQKTPTSADRDTRLNPLAALVFSSRWLQLPLAAARDALANAYTGITCAKVTATGVMWQTNIHTIFILSALGIAWTDKAMTGSSSKREQHAH